MMRLSALLVLILIWLVPVSPNQLQVLAIIAIVVFGIPHGASDHLVAQHLSSKKSFRYRRFLRNYLGAIAGFLLMWILAPLAALMFFLVVSVFHFGQEYIHNRESLHPTLATWLWGSFALLLPFVCNWDQAALYFESLSGFSFTNYIFDLSTIGIVGLLFSYSFLILGTSVFSTKVEERYLIFIDFALLSAVYLTVPLIPAFGIFFIFWHSGDTLQSLFRVLSKAHGWKGWVPYIKKLLPFSLLAIAGISSTTVLVHHLEQNFLVEWIFVFISLITLPHVLLFDQFYQELDHQFPA